MCATRRISVRQRALPCTGSLGGFTTQRPLNCGPMRPSLSFQPCVQYGAIRRGFMNNVFNSHRPVRHCHVYRTLTRVLTVGTLLGSGLVAHAMQQRFNPNTGALMASQAQPSNVTCNVSPGSISARQPTNVNISLAASTNANTTARMAASMPATLFLGRSSGNRYTALGAFTAHPQEQGVVYNITVTINEPE